MCFLCVVVCVFLKKRYYFGGIDIGLKLTGWSILSLLYRVAFWDVKFISLYVHWLTPSYLGVY